ncbi:MAG: hypothetical protein EZS28_003835 [Streblomastix strix]|uniref:Uncharacterized protein n=1 Tax=Streblomastix strix TaxID=222440 RepID=A0A5J4X1M3_9EUKA|nr:MAG: hypothetical protein EZS28_003835 [Streblomastix strix]
MMMMKKMDKDEEVGYINKQDEDEAFSGFYFYFSGQGGGVIGSEGGNNVNYEPTDGRTVVDDLVKFEEDNDYGIYFKERVDQGTIYSNDQVFKSEEEDEDDDEEEEDEDDDDEDDEDEEEDEGIIQFKEDDQVGITIEDEEDEEFDGKIEDVAVEDADNEDLGKQADYEIESDVYELNYEEDEGKSYFVEVCGQLINYYEDDEEVDYTGKFADDDQIYDFAGEVEFSFVGDVIQFYEEFNNEDVEGTDIDVDETQDYCNKEEDEVDYTGKFADDYDIQDFVGEIGIVLKEEDEEDEIYSFVFDYYQGGTDIYVDDIYQLEEEDETGVLCFGDDQCVQYEVYDENVGFVGDWILDQFIEVQEEDGQEKVGKVVVEYVYYCIKLEVDGTLNFEGEYYYYEVYDVVIYGIDYTGD